MIQGEEKGELVSHIALTNLIHCLQEVGDFFKLAWTGVDEVKRLTENEVEQAKLVGIGGDAAKMLAAGGGGGEPVGDVREFRHSGSARAIRHRCVAYKRPTPQMLEQRFGGVNSRATMTGADSCGYSYEMVVEAQLVPRLPVSVYASELRLRAASNNSGTTVEWTATIVVRDEKIIAAVSEESEKSLESLKSRLN